METQKKTTDSYDEIKGMLNTIRRMQTSSHKSLREQSGEGNPNPTTTTPQQSQIGNNQPNPQQVQQTGNERKDFIVVNNVEIVFNSTDTLDLTLKDEEKGKISQLIDDFRTEVGEITTFGKLNFYQDSAKLDGQLNDLKIGFILSAGDENGVFLVSASMLKLTDEVMTGITKLRLFENKFTSVINDLIATRNNN